MAEKWFPKFLTPLFNLVRHGLRHQVLYCWKKILLKMLIE